MKFDEEQTMYYHPLMFDWAKREHMLAQCQALVGIWLGGVARQQEAHAEAVGTYCARKLEELRLLSEARDNAQFAAQWLACVAPQPLGLAELSTRLAGIAVDTHRKLGQVVGLHADEWAKPFVEVDAGMEKPRHDAASGLSAGRRQQMG